MNLSQKIAFNTSIQFIGKIFTAITTLVITMLIGWKLGAEGLGQYVRITSFVTIWFVLLDFGINPIAVKAISKVLDRDKQKIALRDNYKMLLGLRSAVTIFILILATIILFLLPKENYTPIIRQAIIVGYIQILGQSIVSSSMPVFQVTLTYFWATIANLIGSLLSLFLSGYIIWQGGGVFQIVVASMAGWIVIAVATYYFAAKHTGFVLPEFDFSKWPKLLKQALPVGLALLFNIVFVKLNMQMLQILSLPSAVIEKYGSIDAQTGYYGLALRFFENVITVPFFFSNAIFPILIQRKEESIETLRKFMEKSVNIMLLIGIPIAIGGLILSPQLIYFVSGGFLPGAEESEFIPAIPALQILIAGIGVFFTTGVMTWTPIIMDKQWLLPKIYGRILIITIILDIILIPHFGYVGAVVITVLGELFTFISHYYYSNKLIGFKFDFIYFLKTLIASILMGIVVYFVNLKFEGPIYFFIPMLLGIISYFAVGYFLGIFDANLIKSVITIQRKK